MSSTSCRVGLALLFFAVAEFFCLSTADIGTAAHYTAPYAPTACYGWDLSQFPSSNLFGAAGEAVWDNGAACGRQYLVRCISVPTPRICRPGQTIQIKIVDRAISSVTKPSRAATTIVLNKFAFAAIANDFVPYVNIEFTQF